MVQGTEETAPEVRLPGSTPSCATHTWDLGMGLPLPALLGQGVVLGTMLRAKLTSSNTTALGGGGQNLEDCPSSEVRPWEGVGERNS